jgi:hypothetical protein
VVTNLMARESWWKAWARCCACTAIRGSAQTPRRLTRDRGRHDEEDAWGRDAVGRCRCRATTTARPWRDHVRDARGGRSTPARGHREVLYGGGRRVEETRRRELWSCGAYS